MSARAYLLFVIGLGAASAACTGDQNASNDTGSGPGSPSSTAATTSAGGGDAGGAGGAGPSTGGSGGTPGYTIDPAYSWHQPALSTSIHFAPLDGLEDHVLAHLGQAQTSIRLAFFNIRLEEVRDLLVAKKNAGVDVHVILDKKQQDLTYNTMGEELQQLGVPVTLIENTSAEFATMHDKFAILDGHLVMTGSANYSYTALNVSDEDLVTIDDSALAARYQLEFDELLVSGNDASQLYPPNAPIEAWMGPEDGLRWKVVDALDAAQNTAVAAMFDLNQSDIVGALVDAHTRGVNVVVVLDKIQADQPGADADEALSAQGVPVILADNTGGMQAEMHSKFLVVDHQTVVIGSYNWTNLASFYNDENLLLIRDDHLAARVEGKLAQLLDAYNAPAPATLGLVEGPQQVSFEVSNVSVDPGVELVIESEGGGPFANPVVLNAGKVTANVAAGTRVTYRYSIRHNGSTLVEESSTHSFTVPYAPGPFSVIDAFTP